MEYQYGKLFNIREFKDEVDKNYSGIELSHKDLYDITLKVYIKKYRSGSHYGEEYLKKALCNLSEELFGDSSIWESELTQPKFEVSSKYLYRVFDSAPLSKAFVKNHVRDDVEAYSVAKSVLFNMLQEDSKHTSNVRYVVRKYALALEGNKEAWKKDYEAFLKDKVFVIKKAGRGGQYDEIKVTASELFGMKQKDEQLEDVDENL